MPNYSNATPPTSLFNGQWGYSFGTYNSYAALSSQETVETMPAGAQAGAQFALTNPDVQGNQGRTVTWETSYAGSPSAISAVLQGAIRDVDGEYFTLDTSTNTAGEQRTITGVRQNFLRIKVASVTGGTGIIAKILP